MYQPWGKQTRKFSFWNAYNILYKRVFQESAELEFNQMKVQKANGALQKLVA